MGKKKLLLVWDHRRKDLIRQFLALEKEYDLSFIYYKDKTEDTGGLKVRCWNEFASPYDLLDELKPHKVIFADIETYYEVALNLTAKNSGIETFIVDHGLREPEEVEFAFKEWAELISKRTDGSGPVSSSPSSGTAGFYLRSIRAKNIFSLFDLIRFAYIRRKYNPTVALVKCRAPFRRPSRYLCYSRKNMEFFMIRDNAKESDFKMIGNPSFDEIFRMKGQVPVKDYMLLIDAPLELTKHSSVSVGEKKRFFEKVNEYCLRQKLQLKIKLHPHSYGKPHFLEHPNIEYIELGDSNELISGSRECCGFHSTLMIPAIVLKPCTIFKTDNYPFQENVEKLGVAQVLDMNDFSAEMISPVEDAQKEKGLQQFIDWYLYKADSKGLDRLRSILEE